MKFLWQGCGLGLRLYHLMNIPGFENAQIGPDTTAFNVIYFLL